MYAGTNLVEVQLWTTVETAITVSDSCCESSCLNGSSGMSKLNVIVVSLVVVIVFLSGALLLRHKCSTEQTPAVDKSGRKFTSAIRFDKLSPSSLSAMSAKTKLPLVQNITMNKQSSPFAWDSLQCSRWAVVTTVNGPTTSVQRQAQIRDGKWCLLVVADANSPDTYTLEPPHDNYLYLSVKQQKEMMSRTKSSLADFMNSLSWDHVGRKNVGYLYAILHGATYIWDLDDDVTLQSKYHTIPVPGEVDPSMRLGSLAAHTHTARSSDVQSFDCRVPSAMFAADIFNPYPLFDANHNPAWPRGFPAERILSNSSMHDAPIATHTVSVPASSIGVVQYLANHDPDVDSLYRMIRPLPLDFPLHGHLPLILPASGADASAAITSITASATTNTASVEGSVAVSTSAAPSIFAVPAAAHTVYAPYNAQSTLHTFSAMFALLLPLSPHPRVTDIYRAYIAQRLFADVGLRIAFHSPIVTHIRRTKDITLHDVHTEMPLYDSHTFVRALKSWKGTSTTLPGRMEELYVALYEQGYVGVEDVQLVQKWLTALIDMGYMFPPLSPNH